MKKPLLLAFAFIFSITLVRGQIADGSLLENNIIVTDMDGNQWDLFSILDEGKTVVLDLFAEWCPPCWTYHNSHALANLYNQYGPDGTDELMVIGVETDPSTPITSLTGGAGSTYGWDWTAGTPYPLANQNIGGIFQQGYYPYIIRICPNRQIFELGQASAPSIYSQIGSCLSAEGEINPHILSYTGETESCGAIELAVKFQNLGTQTLESNTFEVKVAGEVVMTSEWTGSLEPYQLTNFTLGELSIAQNTVVQITTGADDEFPDALTKSLTFGGPPTTTQITVRVTPDNNPEETTWEVVDASGTVVKSGGPYDSSQSGTPQFSTFNIELGCHQFIIYDEGGDGMSGAGMFLVFDSESQVITGGGASAWSEKKTSFNAVTQIVGVSDVSPGGSVRFFPNPSTGEIKLDLDLLHADEVELRVHDMSGRLVFNRDFGRIGAGANQRTIDLGALNPGVYFAEITAGSGNLRVGHKIVLTR